MSERYGIDVIRSWTSEVGLNGPGSTTAADCLRGAIYICDSFDLSLRSVRKKDAAICSLGCEMTPDLLDFICYKQSECCGPT